ncbi:hypothetical protein T310_7405 [Rasamsonia emersonii CBS 393.64]|uniref:Heat shock factor binding protein 1 n=1 Tax=Rasamsonia emersonii (strain ATCC 16479 / CBS 393.64 / IMI 116815) TaxID=1408163 RepID=A0A0F4YKK9_RASE3|nr:hypothetical protein T310_7405 [Rasamsonia emersonii CBS 393.64]KKA18635.1 hypothetical protein T310_7405 [Rasamsonia emersonii CBS 393.64]
MAASLERKGPCLSGGIPGKILILSRVRSPSHVNREQGKHQRHRTVSAVTERNSKNSKLTAETQNQNTSTATPTDTGAGAQELAAAVDDLLDQLQHKFDKVSTEIFGKLDDMARRLDELEASLTVAEETAAAATAKS